MHQRKRMLRRITAAACSLKRAARLRSVAATATTAGVKARLSAQEHERIARQLAELDVAD